VLHAVDGVDLGIDAGETLGLVGDVPNPINPPAGCHFHPRCPKVMERCKSEAPLFREIGGGHWAACHLNDAAG
jgi:oligopeptide/dipeptide ABC transporter ATP-binding protein